MDIIFGDEDLVGPRGRQAGRQAGRQFRARKMSLNTENFGSTKHSDSFSFTKLHVRTSNTKHKLFNIRRPDQRTLECKHLSRSRIPTNQAADGKNGRPNFALVSDISASQILSIASMLFTLTGEPEQIRELIESLESVPIPSSAELLNEY